jgi:hypothetical protein
MLFGCKLAMTKTHKWKMEKTFAEAQRQTQTLNFAYTGAGARTVTGCALSFHFVC